MTPVIAFANGKGGSGKTTTAVSLGAAWAEAQKRVLLVDLDPQGSATKWIAVDQDDGRAWADVLTDWPDRGSLRDVAQPSRVPGLDIIRSGRWLSRAARGLLREPGGERVLPDLVRRDAGTWDAILIDPPPAIDFLTLAALASATYLVIPVELTPMGLDGVPEILSAVEQAHKRLGNPDLALLAVVPCRYRAGTILSRDAEASLRQRFAEKVTHRTVHENVRLAEAPSAQESVFAYAPGSRGAHDYRAVVDELTARAFGQEVTIGAR